MLCKIEDCTGCLACYNACPNGAIQITLSDKGFVFPEINTKKCLKCGKCNKICNTIQALQNNLNDTKEIYAAYSLNKKIRSISSSGGVFSEISNFLLDNNYLIYGASFSESDNSVLHTCVNSKRNLDKLRRSKYVQSNIGSIFLEIKQKLNNSENVCFSGTPCQVYGLKCFLGKEYSNLITIDLACHGVCSPKVWQDYLTLINNKIGTIKNINFRSKKWSWNYHSMYITGENGDYDGKQEIDPYYRLFLNDYIIRENCFTCKFRSFNRAGDITLGDFWELEIDGKINKSEKGHSLVLINSQVGANIFASVKKNLYYLKSTRENAVRNQAFTHVDKPEDYELFWMHYSEGKKIEDLANEFVAIHINKKNRLKYFIGNNILYSFIMFVYEILQNTKKSFRVIFDYIKNIAALKKELHGFLNCFHGKKVFHLDDDRTKNLGDLAQAYLIHRWIEENFPDYKIISFTQNVLRIKRVFFFLFRLFFNIKTDLIIFQSGYNTQDLGGRSQEFHEDIIKKFPNATIIMMPQTIFFKNENNMNRCIDIYSKATNLFFLSRDIISYEKAKKMFPNNKVYLYPDIVTTLIGQYTPNAENRDGILFVIRDDSEKFFSDSDINTFKTKLETEFCIKIPIENTILKEDGYYIYDHIDLFLNMIINEYSKYKLIITDKYHGTIFSLVSGTPTLVLKTNDHKVSTGIKWFEGNCREYISYSENLDDAYIKAIEMYRGKYSYDLKSDNFKRDYYDKLREEIVNAGFNKKK